MRCDAVEQFQPLFHLLNGDLCYANLNPAAQPAVWADFGEQRASLRRISSVDALPGKS